MKKITPVIIIVGIVLLLFVFPFMIPGIDPDRVVSILLGTFFGAMGIYIPIRALKKNMPPLYRVLAAWAGFNLAGVNIFTKTPEFYIIAAISLLAGFLYGLYVEEILQFAAALVSNVYILLKGGHRN